VWPGYALALAGAVSTAVAAVFIRRRLPGTDAVWLTAAQTGVGLLAVAPVAVAVSGLPLAAVSTATWLAVAYTGLVGSFTAYLLMMVLIKRFGATAGVLPGYVVPVAGLVLGALLVGEVVGPVLLGGAALTLAGLGVATR
jgi:drug/metabolite transporter (DMT)-like permease